MIPSADYDLHPAFSPFCRRTQENDGFRTLHTASDEIINEFLLTGGRHNDIIENNIKRYEDALLGDTQIDPRLREALCAAFRDAHKTLIDEKRARATIGNASGCSMAVQDKVERLYHQGYFLAQCPPNLLAELQALLASDMAALREKAALGNGAINYAFPGNPEIAATARKCFEETGVFESISAFYGRPYDRFEFVLHHSSSHDNWFYVFDDLGLPLAKTHALHFDANFGVAKALFYLNDVSKENGAFSLVPHTTPHENVEFDLAFAKAMLTELTKFGEKELGWTFHGNESIFRRLEARELFASLPHSLRRTPNSGDHFLDDSAESKTLLSREAVLEGPAGFFPIFLGCHTMHRGGITKSGERFALQFLFHPQESVAPPATPMPAPILSASKTRWQKFREIIRF